MGDKWTRTEAGIDVRIEDGDEFVDYARRARRMSAAKTVTTQVHLRTRQACRLGVGDEFLCSPPLRVIVGEVFERVLRCADRWRSNEQSGPGRQP